MIPLQRIGGAIFTALVSIGSLFGLFVADDIPLWIRLPAWLAFVLLTSWHAYRWPPIAYRHTSYRVDGQGIEIRRGVYWRSGLGTLIVYTAGTDPAKVERAGLEHGRALRIREHLLPSESSDAV